MTLTILIKKMHFEGKKVLTRDIIKDYCKRLNLDYNSSIKYLIRNKYLYRILKGIFYMPSIEERKFKRMDLSYFDALSEALKIKGVKNWYFGLNSALKLNSLTHEFFMIDYIINDTIFRAKPITILGQKIKFIKMKKDLFNFGIKKNKINFSEPEKIALDIIYLSLYNGLAEKEIKMKIFDIVTICSKKKILKYSSHYNKTTEKFVKETLWKP